ncbi:MAG TPA: GNAT family N-acetyltransferase [Actinotalea sp.]
MTSIERVDEDQWERLRALRIAAFEHDAEVFGSSLEREAGLKEMHWRMRARASAWFVAVQAGADVGLVCAIQEPGAAEDDRHVVGLWVRPQSRGGGVGDALVAAVGHWARSDGAMTVSLWVTEDNAPAQALYRRNGFEPTGESMPLPRDPSRVEHRWHRVLNAS